MKKAKILSTLMAIAITATPTIVNTTSNFSKYQNQLTAHAVDAVDENYTGWKFRDGWWYYYVNGKFVTGTKTIDGKIYCFTSGGHMLTHWYRYIGLNYYFGEDGAQRTGWVRIKNDNHFYGDYSAPERYSEKCKNYDEWFYFNKNGIMLTGWHTIDGQRYFFVPDEIEYRELLGDKPEGYMYHGMLQDDGKTYYLDKNGAMATGWKKIGDVWYYFNKDGIMVTGWEKIGDVLYYFSKEGVMQTGWVKDKGKWYYLNNDGSPKTGWLNDGNFRYYLLSDGSMCTGWKQIENNWYYFSSGGVMKTGWLEDKGRTYYFDETGKMVTGEAMINNRFYYFEEQYELTLGARHSGWYMKKDVYYKMYLTPDDELSPYKISWYSENGDQYCFNDQGFMITGKFTVTEGGKKVHYYFNEYGKLQKNCDVTIDGQKYHANYKGELTSY